MSTSFSWAFEALPFFGLLVSIAFFATFFPKKWARDYVKVVGFFIALSLVMGIVFRGLSSTSCMMGSLLFWDYVPFMMLLTSLYVVSGGLKLRLHVHATPLLNTLTLAFFTLIAGVLGTTGASMLGIHPLLVMNKHRHFRSHTVVFFIFLVCNIGGGLSSIGDPPLFLGFLKGVSFFWPTKNLWRPVLFLTASLLLIYFALDSYYFHREPEKVQVPPKRPSMHIEGQKQLILACLVIMTLVIPSLFSGCAPFSLKMIEVIKIVLLLLISACSFKITSLKWRYAHKWTFHPLIEVALIFFGLFITAHPLIHLLEKGAEGPFQFLLTHLHQTDGSPSSWAYFWWTGLLSGFLDNAPTYLVFFKATGYSAATLMNEASSLLRAISMGAVFMGALTYIGNAPNLLTQTIAEEEYKVKMPSFMVYMVCAFVLLMPLFYITAWLFL